MLIHALSFAVTDAVRGHTPRPAAKAMSSEPRKSGFFSALFGSKEKKKEEVSGPTDFKHVQHIGYDPEKGFECSQIPEQWKSLFRNAGLCYLAALFYDSLSFLFASFCIVWIVRYSQERFAES